MNKEVKRMVQVGMVYRDMGGQRMLVLRDVPKQELGVLADPRFDYVEVAFANQPDHANGWRRKVDGKYPPYAHWDQHSCHLILEIRP